MTASEDTRSTLIFDQCLASELPESFAATSSPEVRALAAEWITSSRAYFRAIGRWGRISNALPSREQIETECDLAIMQDEAVRRRIIDLRSAELSALALKAAVFVVHLPSISDVDTLIGDLDVDDGPGSEAIAVALARDVAEVLGPSVQALADMARPGRRS